MRLVFISDTHNRLRDIAVPDGDVLLHCGDATSWGRREELINFNVDMSRLPHEHKLFIPGNHDLGLEEKVIYSDTGDLIKELNQDNAKYLTCMEVLFDSSIEINGLKIYGAPWQPAFGYWAFNLERGEELKEKWNLIPSDTDIALTHGPPLNILDRIDIGDHVGCADLKDAISKVKPLIHAFGHIHEAYGKEEDDNTTYLNASCCTLAYTPTNKPWIVDLFKNKDGLWKITDVQSASG